MTWLSDSQQRSWRSFLWTSRLLLDRLDQQLRRDSALPHTHYMILAMLSEAPGSRLRMGELARLLGYSPSRATHAVDRLAGLGYTTRTQQTPRNSWVTLTSEGLKALEKAAPGHVKAVRENFVEVLTPEELETLTSLLDKVRNHLDPADTCPPAPHSAKEKENNKGSE